MLYYSCSRLPPATPKTNRYPVPHDPSKGPAPVINRFSKENPSPDNGLYYSWEVPGEGAAHAELAMCAHTD